MKLNIRDNKELINTDFGNWLLQFVKARLRANIYRYNLKSWDLYLTSSESLTRLFDKPYKASDIVQFACNSLVCKGGEGDITIEFVDEKYVPGFDRLSLGTIIKTINYGTLEFRACPIFSDTLNYFAATIDTYVGLYYRL